ncbi:hypothetical protein L083_2225 [Actinoplanes sp. N902-109]|nr:hypothetical protein L083_2225 [Actinoplanes sp. N902-109]
MWLGTAELVRADDAEAAREVVGRDLLGAVTEPRGQLGRAVLDARRYAAIEVHRWASGGRPS